MNRRVMVKQIMSYFASELAAMTAQEIADHCLPGEVLTEADWTRLAVAVEEASRVLDRLSR